MLAQSGVLWGQYGSSEEQTLPGWKAPHERSKNQKLSVGPRIHKLGLLNLASTVGLHISRPMTMKTTKRGLPGPCGLDRLYSFLTDTTTIL